MTALLNHVATSRGKCGKDIDYILVDLRALLVEPVYCDEEGGGGLAGPALGPAQRAEAADLPGAVGVDDIVDVPGGGNHM